tara:strand:- start:91 stop:483 length:393 start_codon:yes stop_codon:yes gene_type:complete
MKSAKKIAENHHDSINAQDTEAYLESVKFPFTYQNYNGVSITVETPEAYKSRFPMPWAIIKRTDPNWSHSDLVQLEEVACSKSSVAYKFVGRRVNTDGSVEPDFQAIWIAVYSGGKWGIQFRHNLGNEVE